MHLGPVRSVGSATRARFLEQRGLGIRLAGAGPLTRWVGVVRNHVEIPERRLEIYLWCYVSTKACSHIWIISQTFTVQSYYNLENLIILMAYRDTFIVDNG